MILRELVKALSSIGYRWVEYTKMLTTTAAVE